MRADQPFFAADGRSPLRLQRKAAEEEEDGGERDRGRNDESESDLDAWNRAGHHHG